MPSGKVMSDIVLIHFNNATLNEAMDKIAQGLNATWQKADDGFLLKRSSANLLKEERELQEAFRKGLEEYKAKHETPDPLTAKEFREHAFSDTPLSRNGITRPNDYPKNKAPGQGAVGRLMQVFTPKMLTGIPSRERIQFALDPLPSQERLPIAARKVLQDLRKEHDTLKAVYENLPRENRSRATKIYQPLLRDGGITQVTVIVSRTDWFCTLTLNVFVNGHIAESYRANVSAKYEQGESSIKWAEFGQPIEWTEDDRVYFEYMSSAPRIGERPLLPMPDSILESFKNMDQAEPLSGAPSTAILQFLQKRGLNAVYTVPDIAYATVSRERYSSLDIAAKAAMNGQVKLVDGWLIGTTTQIRTARNFRLDRERTAKFISVSLDDGYTSLDAMADYYKTTGQQVYMNRFISLALSKETTSSDWMSGTPMAFELYASLPDSARTKVRNDRLTVNWAQLPIRTRQKLLKFIRSSSLAVTDKPYEVLWKDWRSVRETDKQSNEVIGADMPFGTKVRLVTDRKDSLAPAPPKNGRSGGRGRYMSPEDFAQGLVFQEKGISSGNLDFGKVTVNSSVRVLMQIEMPGIGYFQNATIIDETPFDLKPIPLSKAPEGLRTAVEKEIAKAREMYKNTGTGRKVIPPAN